MEQTQKSAGGIAVVMIPVLFCFFCMGFVDLVGIASNYAQKDLGLSDSQANLFPSLVFFWFLIFSVPVGLLMNKIGRKNTVLISLLLTLLSLICPIFLTSFWGMLFAFSLLGIGNAFMQTSLNPLVSNIISPQHLASTLTFGQFIKAIASFLAPLLAMWGSLALIPNFGIGWRALFPIYAAICILSTILLARVKIREAQSDKVSGIMECVRLLIDPFVLVSFCGIMCHVGIDVGTNTTAPRILMERMGLGLEDAGIATSIYFIFRTLGCLAGAGLLRKIAAKPFFLVSVLMILAGLGCIIIGQGKVLLYIGIALIGLGNSNVFSVIFAQALNRRPNEGNEVSGLMIMGLFGGTLFPLFMGFASDAVKSQIGAIMVMIIGGLYLIFYSFWIRSINTEGGENA